MSAQAFTVIEFTRIADFGYPDGCYVVGLQAGALTVHLIWYNGDPGVLFNAAPNGSVLIDAAGAGAARLYLKAGTLGASDGTWKYQGVNT